MSIAAVLIRKSTGEIIKHANYPNDDGSPIVGLDPDLEWLAKYIPYVAPDYDPRIFVLQQTEAITIEPHPLYTNLKQYKITYATNRRTDAEIILHIENAETEANETLLNYKERTKIFVLAVGVLIRRLDNLATSPKEKAILDKMTGIATNVWKNDTELKAKLTQVADGLEPNIDALWVKL